MDVTPYCITRDVTLDLIDSDGIAVPMDAQLMYDRSDPYAVVAEFHTATGVVRWVFARQLLRDGLYHPCGEGDIRAWPFLDAEGHALIILELSSPEGDALLQAHSIDVADFLHATDDAVPFGAEDLSVDVDAAIEQLLAS